MKWNKKSGRKESKVYELLGFRMKKKVIPRQKTPKYVWNQKWSKYVAKNYQIHQMKD